MWARHIVGNSLKWLDRISIVDINQDGRLDIVSTEETQDWTNNANIHWFEAPLEPKSGGWQRNTVATLRSVSSMDVIDFDRERWRYGYRGCRTHRSTGT